MTSRLRRRLELLWSDYRRSGSHGVMRRLSWAGPVSRDWFCFTEVEVLSLRRFNASAVSRALSGYDLRMLDERAVRELASCGGQQALPLELFKQMFAEGARCAGAYFAGRLIGYCWAFRGEYALVFDGSGSRKIALTLGEHDIVLGTGLIDEAHRLKGLFPHLLACLIGQSPQDSRVYVTIDTLNWHSLMSHQRLGFVSEGLVRYVGTPISGRTTFKPTGTQEWREGAPAMYLKDLCAWHRHSRFIRTPIVETAIGQALRDFFDAAGHLPFTQTLTWLSTFGAGTGAVLFATFEAGQVIACSIVTEHRIPILGKTIYRIQNGPVYTSEASLRQHVTDLAAAVAGRSICIEVSPCSPGIRPDAVSSLLQSCGFAPTADGSGLPSTLVLTLERTPEELWAAMSEASRTSIEGAERAGVTVSAAPTSADVESLVQLYAGESAGAGWGRLKTDVLQRLVSAERRDAGSVRLLVATHNGQVAAAAIAIVHRDRLAVLPVASNRARHLRGLSLRHAIEWQAVKCAREMGLRYCDLHLLHRPQFGFTAEIQQTVPLHVRVSSPVLARALGVAAQVRTDAGFGWRVTKTLRRSGTFV